MKPFCPWVCDVVAEVLEDLGREGRVLALDLLEAEDVGRWPPSATPRAVSSRARTPLMFQVAIFMAAKLAGSASRA